MLICEVNTGFVLQTVGRHDQGGIHNVHIKSRGLVLSSEGPETDSYRFSRDGCKINNAVLMDQECCSSVHCTS